MIQEKTWAEDRSEQLTAKKTQLANTLKRWSTSLVIGEKANYNNKALFLTQEIRKKCRSLTLIIGRDVRKGAFSNLQCTFWNNHFGM